MNRIQHLTAGTELLTVKRGSGSAQPGHSSRGEWDAPHALFTPLHYERNYAYPLIIWLHGPADDERQLNRVLPLVSMRNYVAVAPRGTVASQPAHDCDDERLPLGYEWHQSPEQISLAEHRVFAAKAAAERRFSVARNRIFLAGFGCGGTMAMRLALNHPTCFAGAASFGGLFPCGYAPLGRLAEARKLKLLLATCRDSIDYPPEQVCEHLRLFHSAGLSVCLRQYPCGDELTTAMLADMDRWIMDQFITSSNAPLDEAATQRRD